MCTVCHGLFNFPLDVIGRVCSGLASVSSNKIFILINLFDKQLN